MMPTEFSGQTRITTNLNDPGCNTSARLTYLWLQVVLLQALWWMTPQLVQVLRLKRCLSLHGKCSELEHRPGYASVKNNHHPFHAASVVVRGSSYLSWLSVISFSSTMLYTYKIKLNFTSLMTPYLCC